MTIGEVLSKPEMSPSELLREKIARDEMPETTKEEKDAIEDRYQDAIDEAYDLAEQAATRVLTDEEKIELKAAIKKLWIMYSAFDEEPWVWSSIERIKKKAVKVEKAAEAAAAAKRARESRKPTTVREFEQRLRTMGFSKSEARGIIETGYRSVAPNA